MLFFFYETLPNGGGFSVGKLSVAKVTLIASDFLAFVLMQTQIMKFSE